MSKELPPPLTNKSSKREMWDEIKAMQQEIDSQQQNIRLLSASADKLRASLTAMTDQCATYEWQLGIIRVAAGNQS